MIGLRVKGATRVVALLLALGAVHGCSRKSQPPAIQPPAAVSMPVGAERWQDGALLLPARSPVVVSGRLDALLSAAQRLKAWVTAEPAMLGEDGPQIVRTIESGWLAATGYLGVDPLLTRAWTERGVDPHRPIYAGMYPVERDGTRFVSAIETVLREELGVAPGNPVGPSVQMLAAAGGELPQGTNARILRTLSETQPVGGLRVVIGTTSNAEFLTTASSFAEGMGFRMFPLAVTGGEKRHVLWSETGVPAMSIRFAGDRWAVLDLLFPAFVGGALKAVDPKEDLAQLHADLMRATTEVTPGRPHAPAPPGEPTLAVSFDQQAVGQLVRLRGYHASLEALQTTRAERRDAELLSALATTVSQGQAWDVASDELTGTTFQLTIDRESAHVGRLGMSMFAREGLPAVDTADELPSLRLSQRNSAVGFDLHTLRATPWRKWFGAGTPDELVALQIDSLPHMHDLLPIFRSGVLAFSNIGADNGTSTLFDEFGELVTQLTHIRRVEVVGLGPTLPVMKERPEMIVAAVLLDATDEQIHETQATVGNLLGQWSGFQMGIFPRLTAEKTATTMLSRDGQQTQVPVHHRLATIGGDRVLMTGFGLSLEAFDAEVAELAAHRVDGVIEARVGPIALVSWLVDDAGELYFGLDPDILAQRLGALNLRYGATPQGESQVVTLAVELEAAPDL